MKFELQFKKDEQTIIFDNLEFFEFFYTDENEVDIVDTSFKAKTKAQLEQIMTIYEELFHHDDEEGGADGVLKREGGAAIKGRVYIYPTTGKNAKIHINVKN